MPGAALGNPSFSGGENNGMPFGFISIDYYGAYGIAAMTDGSHTIKITEETKVYKKLEEYYLPGGVMPNILKTHGITLTDGVPDTEALCNIGSRFDDIAETLWNGGRVVLDFALSEELKSEGCYKADVVEWKLVKKSDGAYAIYMWWYFNGNRFAYRITGGTWTPPAE